MKSHILRLHESPFNAIKSGKKDIEYRLNDEKRKQIEIGDKITFYKKSDEIEKIEVIVTELKIYKSLLEMYTATFEKDFKNKYKTPQEVVDDTPYYSKEEVNKYGCLAIYFKKV